MRSCPRPRPRPLAARVLFSAALTVAFVCSVPARAGSPSSTTTASAPTPSGAAASAPVVKPAALPAPWKEMNAQQRGKYMKKVVSPQMKVLFRTFDAAAFKKFDCATCHGKNAEDNKFKMPSSDVHPLPPTPEAFQAMLKEKPEWPRWTKFMSEQVVPQMAALLGVPAFNPKTPGAGGFSCEACHTFTKK